MLKNAVESWNVSRVEVTPAQAEAKRPNLVVLDGGAKETSHLDRAGWQRLLAFLERGEAGARGEAYETVRKKVIKLLKGKGAINCEELADATFDRVARKLGEEGLTDVENPTGYVLRVARLVWLEAVKHEVACRQRLDRWQASRAPEAEESEEAGERERNLELLERCLATLAPEERQLLVSYYDGQGRSRIEHRQELVKQFGLNAGLLRTRIHRLRAQLEVRVREVLAAQAA